MAVIWIIGCDWKSGIVKFGHIYDPMHQQSILQGVIVLRLYSDQQWKSTAICAEALESPNLNCCTGTENLALN